MPTRRSPYSDKLLAYRDTVLADGRERGRAGAWHGHFRQQVGPEFDGRVVLEIGCHDGALLCAAARGHPPAAFVGLDWTPRHLVHAAGRVAGLGLRNVALLHARAQDVAAMFAPGELDEVWLFHPEPHDLANMLFAEPLLLALASCLRAGGSVCLKTDHPGYFQHALALVGRPEPPDFDLARRRSGIARIKVGELVDPATLRPGSRAVMDRFTVALIATDFWADAAVQARVATRAFATGTSRYEDRFRRKRLPIHFLELQRTRP